MIKDSKLIGTKIAAPFGWQKFKVGELFDVIIPSDSPSDLVDVQDKYHSIPLIKAQTSNHGISGYSSGEGCYIFHSGLTIGMRGSFNVYVHINDVILGNNVAGLALKYNYSARDEYSLVYISSVISKLYAQASGYIGYPTMHKLMYDDIIELPVTADNQPNFEWMSDYIKAVKADYLEQKSLSNRNEIEAYLSAGNTDSMVVTDDDRQFLRDFEKLPRKKFKVGELFDCKPLNRPEIAGYTGYVKDDMVISPYGHTPYLAATSDNNGISGYSDLKANNEANVITLSTTADSSNTIFYQEQEFIGRQQMEGLRLKSKVLTKNLAFYFIPFIKKQACLFNYGNKLTVNKLKNFIIIVPVIDSSQIDAQSIEKYMQIQIKLTIAKHAKYLDKELALMKTV